MKKGLLHQDRYNIIFCLTLYALFFSSITSSIAADTSSKHLFATGPLKEIDRCASAWLIKRHVDPDAIFRFYNDNELDVEGVAFDMPLAEFRRTHNQSTFEVILARYHLDDTKLLEIAKIIHDIEINAWEKRKEYKDIILDIRKITEKSRSDVQRLQGCIDYFDRFGST